MRNTSLTTVAYLAMSLILSLALPASGLAAEEKASTYSAENPHPACKGIVRAYVRISGDKEKVAKRPSLATSAQYCLDFGTPYFKLANLVAKGSIKINNDESFAETENATLTLTPSTIPEKMQFSDGKTPWSELEPFSYTKSWLIEGGSPGIRTVYVRYKTGDNFSPLEYDRILLAPQYDAEYRIQRLPALESGRFGSVTLHIQNRGSLTWNSQDPQNPVQLTYRFKDSSGNKLEPRGFRGLFAKPVGYGEAGNITLMVQAPSTPGKYTLEFDLEHEGVALFSDMGVDPFSRQVTVLAPSQPLPSRPTLDPSQVPIGVD